MNSATITIQGVESKSGVSAAGKAWTKFTVDTSDGKFSTFDTALADQARAAMGRTVAVTYEVSEYGSDPVRHSKDLKSLIVDPTIPAAAPHVEPVRSQTPNGDVDWDMIGLRKTRCALWVACLGAGLSVDAARAAVLSAEVDIFWRQPAEATSDIPFD